MFIKSVVTSLFLVALATSVHAHAGVTPALGVAGTMVRADVQRPNGLRACGKTDIAANIDTSTPITPNADGTFDATITNFNRGLDGSRQLRSVKIDPTGTGDNFVDADVLQNGERAPDAVGGSDPIKVQMPAGMSCTGGASGNLCLAQFTTLSGFGNCAVISTGASGAGNATASDNSTTSGAATGSEDGTATETGNVASTGDGATTKASDATATGTSNSTSVVGTGVGSAGATASGSTAAAAAGSRTSGVGSVVAKAGQIARAARATMDA